MKPRDIKKSKNKLFYNRFQKIKNYDIIDEFIVDKQFITYKNKHCSVKIEFNVFCEFVDWFNSDQPIQKVKKCHNCDEYGRGCNGSGNKNGTGYDFCIEAHDEKNE